MASASLWRLYEFKKMMIIGMKIVAPQYIKVYFESFFHILRYNIML